MRNEKGQFVKGHKPLFTGGMTGRKHTQEWKDSLSERMKGNKYAEGTPAWNSGLKGYKSGEENSNWKGGVTSENDKIRKSKEYKDWARAVYKRDNWSCLLCPKKCQAGDIVAHHCMFFADHPEMRFVVQNGVTLCRSCHLSLHKKLDRQKLLVASLDFS